MASLVLALVRAGQEYEEPGAAGGLVAALLGTGMLVVWLAVVLLVFVSLWKIFEKAGEPGWAGIVPIYNLVVMLKICGKPIWWIVLFLLPCANIVAFVLIGIALAEKFGKGSGFGIGLGLLPFVFYPLLAFGDARYRA